VEWAKYPRTKRLLEETGMTLEQALIWTECELEKLEVVVNEKHGNRLRTH